MLEFEANRKNLALNSSSGMLPERADAQTEEGGPGTTNNDEYDSEEAY